MQAEFAEEGDPVRNNHRRPLTFMHSATTGNMSLPVSTHYRKNPSPVEAAGCAGAALTLHLVTMK